MALAASGPEPHLLTGLPMGLLMDLPMDLPRDLQSALRLLQGRCIPIRRQGTPASWEPRKKSRGLRDMPPPGYWFPGIPPSLTRKPFGPVFLPYPALLASRNSYSLFLAYPHQHP